MSIDFILPDIGEGIVECELVEWLVKEGDTVIEDQPIADVMTDKALVQIPAMHSGVIDKLFYSQGEIAKIHEPLFSMVTDESEIDIEADAAVSHKDISAEDTEKDVSTGGDSCNETDEIAHNLKAFNSKAIASPAVRRVARELGININEVKGSGKKGRVYKEDLDSIEHAGYKRPVKVPEASNWVEPINGIKAITAKAMVDSVSTIPHFTYCDEIDITELTQLRLELKGAYEKQNIPLTMMPLFMKAMSLALKEYPIINSKINDNCTELTYFNDHNIGMAVDSKVGLLVPNVKQVQHKSILDLASELSRLTTDARNGKSQLADLKGGTITITNIGAIGGTIAVPIINKPEAAIVALGKSQTLPRFNEQGVVEARSIMQVSCSGDHRIIDGASMARFCNLWKSFLEKPSNMLAHLC